MKKFDLTKRILDSGALAVVRATPERVLEIAKGIVDGGIPVMEVSYTNADAPKAIDLVHDTLGDRILVAPAPSTTAPPPRTPSPMAPGSCIRRCSTPR